MAPTLISGQSPPPWRREGHRQQTVCTYMRMCVCKPPTKEWICSVNILVVHDKNPKQQKIIWLTSEGWEWGHNRVDSELEQRHCHEGDHLYCQQFAMAGSHHPSDVMQRLLITGLSCTHITSDFSQQRKKHVCLWPFVCLSVSRIL